jgi:hypothetical protein
LIHRKPNGPENRNKTSEQIRSTGEEIHYIRRKSKKRVYNNFIIMEV